MQLTVTRSAEPPATWAGAVAAASGTFYHDPRWVRAIADCFGFKLTCLTASANGEVVGVLALAEVPPLVGPRRLVSLPFSYVAGPLSWRPGVDDLLAGEARRLATEVGARRVELKRRDAAESVPDQWNRTVAYHTFRVDTTGGVDRVWSTLHQSSVRRGIRKAERSLVVERGGSKSDWLLMSRMQDLTARRHALPPPPKRFFVDCCRQLQDQGLARLYLARESSGDVVGAATLWTGTTEWIYAFGGARQDKLGLRPNHLLLWTALKDAIEAGVTFDLGRASPRQSGLVQFKERWGGVKVPLMYDYWPSPGGIHLADRERGLLPGIAKAASVLPTPIFRMSAPLYRYLG